MEDRPVQPETEAELEAFRQQWRDEVSARNKRPEITPKTSHYRQKAAAVAPVPGPSVARRKVETDYDEVAPKPYHDLPNKEEHLRLSSEGQNHDREGVFKEPTSALEHYERAVEKETHGQLGDSLKHYRTAFKLDDSVHEIYKKKHFPPSSFKPKPSNPNPSNASATVPSTAHHSLHGSGSSLPPTLKQLVDSFSSLTIEAAPPPTDASPQEPSPLAQLPEEILTQILQEVAIRDIASFARLAQVCKRLAYLVLTEESIWKRVALGSEVGFAAMHYDFACDIDGFSIEANDSIARYLGSDSDVEDDEEAVSDPEVERTLTFQALTQSLLHTIYASSYRQMFRSRPRIRFNGCYISTVNYTRPGANSSNTLTWGAPVHVVTYFRYLRFFRDGSAISLLTTTEPGDVVHHLTKDNLHAHHGNTLPSSVMRDALRGRWRLTSPISAHSASPASLSAEESESEGDVLVETEGVVPKYTYLMRLSLSHAGKSARNNKLSWKGFWSHNRLTDDWGEFGLKNDRAFYWSRVRSFGVGV